MVAVAVDILMLLLVILYWGSVIGCWVGVLRSSAVVARIYIDRHGASYTNKTKSSLREFLPFALCSFVPFVNTLLLYVMIKYYDDIFQSTLKKLEKQSGIANEDAQ